jgi:hypothetical protein
MGMGGTCQGWLTVTVPDLIKDRRPIVIFDNRGAGQSEDPGGPFTIPEMAARARAARPPRTSRARTCSAASWAA